MDFLLASLAVFALPAELNNPDWCVREAAESQLKTKLWMQPFLLAAASSDDPELFDRAWRLLRPTRELIAEVRVSDVLSSTWLPPALDYWNDFSLRRRVVRRAIASHWVRYAYYGDVDLHQTPEDALLELAAIRAYFGNHGPGWPFAR